MKDYSVLINSTTVDKILSLVSNNNYAIDSYEGALLDNYIIYDTEKIRIGGIKPRKYIILREKYLNEWSSTTEMIMTDNEKTVDKYVEMFERN